LLPASNQLQHDIVTTGKELSMNSSQVVLITGSSTGFGRLFAETLARRGHTVFATMRDPGGRNAKNADEIRTLAQKESLPIHVLELDVTDDASVGRAVDAAAKAGRIDVAINNAGYYLGGLAEAVTTEQAQRLMDTNFLGPVRVNRAVLPHMGANAAACSCTSAAEPVAWFFLPRVSIAPVNLRSRRWPSRTATNLPRRELNP
jgi:NAD(P)-dependent dehydrogenase (short-subunit alcohol dehydrogenase family)